MEIKFTVYFRYVNVAMNIPLISHYDVFDNPFVYRCQYSDVHAISRCDDEALVSLLNLKSNTAMTQKIPAQSKMTKKRTYFNKFINPLHAVCCCCIKFAAFFHFYSFLTCVGMKIACNMVIICPPTSSSGPCNSIIYEMPSNGINTSKALVAVLY